MATTVDEFKKAFFFKPGNRQLNEGTVETALKQLNSSVGSLDQKAETTQTFRSALVGLVKRFALVKEQNGRPRPELEQELLKIHGETLAQITQVKGFSPPVGAPSPPVVGAPTPPVANPQTNGSPDPQDGLHLDNGQVSANPTPPPGGDDKAKKPGASSADLMEGLDPDAIREINNATDHLFYQKYPNVKKIVPNSPEAEIWLAIRDDVLKRLTAGPKPLDKAKRAELGDQQRDKHMDQIEKALVEVLKLKDEQITELLVYAQDNAIPDKDGTKLLEALSGKSKLGKLSDDAQKGLIQLYALHWLYSPARENQEGAADNIAKLTEALKDADPKTKAMVARMFLVVINSVPNKVLIGANEDVVGEQMNIQRSMRNASIDLDPTGYVQAVKYGDQLAMNVLGNTKARYYQGDAGSGTGSQTRSEDVSLTEERRNALILAVSRGALSKEETDKFFDMMFNWSSDYDVSPRDSLFGHLFDVDPTTVPQQEAMAKLLAKIVNRNHAKNDKDAEDNNANLMAIMKSKGGRELLFSTSMPNEYRLWALDMMSANSDVPGKKPWTAKDLEKGWESPVVIKAFAESTLKQAQASFPQPWKIDGTKERGALINTIAQLMLPPERKDKPDKLPKKDETEDERKKREAEGFNHAMYDDSKEPFKKLLEHIGPGNVQMTPIPVTVMNREEGSALFQVLRVQKDGSAAPFFLDHKGNKYDTIAKWDENEVVPAGIMTYPKELDLGNPLVTVETMKGRGGQRVLDIADKAAMAVGAVAGVALLVGTGGLATPLVAGAVAAYSGVRAVQKLSDMHDRGHDVTDLGDGDVRGAYIDIASNAFAVGAISSARLIGSMTAQGAKISRAGANLIASLTWAGNITDAASIAHQINELAKKWDTMDEAAKRSALLSLGFAVGMKGAAVVKGGGFRNQFDYTRIRNQIENKGIPFSIEKAKDGELTGGQTVAVRNDKGKMTIIYKGDRPPQDVLDLHSNAAVAMEASYTLKEKLKRIMGKADPDNPPRGSAAWEAQHELKKIDAELELNQKKMWNADDKTKKELIARQIELNEAIVKQNARLDYWDKKGSGIVASPDRGADQAKALGWDKAKVPEGYHWVAGDGEPHLFAPGKEKMYYNPRTKDFISEARRSRLEKNGQLTAQDDRFMAKFEPKVDPDAPGIKPEDLKYDKKYYNKRYNAKKSNMPFVDKGPKDENKGYAEFADRLMATLGLEIDQFEALRKLMGRVISKGFGKAWAGALKRSEAAQLKMEKSRVREELAAAAERKSAQKRAAGDEKGAEVEMQRAQKLRKQAKEYGESAYNDVRDKFWDEIYLEKDYAGKGDPMKPTMREQMEAAGLVLEKGQAPYLKVPDPKNPGQFIKMKVSLEHVERKTDSPSKSVDADNLEFSLAHENSAILENIRRIQQQRMGANVTEVKAKDVKKTLDENAKDPGAKPPPKTQ